QEPDLILGLFDVLLNPRYSLSRGVHQLFRLPKVEEGRYASDLARFGEVERLLSRLERPLRNLQFVIEFAHREVSGGDIAHERGDNSFAVLIGAEKTGTRGFGRATQPSPYINLEGK